LETVSEDCPALAFDHALFRPFDERPDFIPSGVHAVFFQPSGPDAPVNMNFDFVDVHIQVFSRWHSLILSRSFASHTSFLLSWLIPWT
jgi:hypothetical protein